MWRHHTWFAVFHLLPHINFVCTTRFVARNEKPLTLAPRSLLNYYTYCIHPGRTHFQSLKWILHFQHRHDVNFQWSTHLKCWNIDKCLQDFTSITLNSIESNYFFSRIVPLSLMFLLFCPNSDSFLFLT